MLTPEVAPSLQLVKMAHKFHHPEKAPPIEDMLMATINLILIPFFMAWTGMCLYNAHVVSKLAWVQVLPGSHPLYLGQWQQ